MEQKLSRRRCVILILLFLLADGLNTDLSRGGPLGWLLCLLAGFLAVPFGRLYLQWLAGLQTRTLRHRLLDVGLLIFTLWTLVRMITDFGGFIRTYNDFTLSPGLICLLLLATAFYLGRLRGHGLARTAELLFWPVMAILVWTFCVGLGDSDFGRLLPIDLQGSGRSLAWLFGRIFSQSLLVLTLLSAEAEGAALRTALRDSSLLAGLTLTLFQAKDIAQAGQALASGYTYPLYALAGLSRMGTGMHIEDLLICALLAARLIKGALLLRLMGHILKKWRKAASPASWTE